jgi:hypothetical protein
MIKYKLEQIGKNFYLLSDEEAYPYAFHLKKKEILEVQGVGEISGELFHDKGWNHKKDCMKLIASTDKKLNKKLNLNNLDLNY